jgi:arginine exporter protein ArgO
MCACGCFLLIAVVAGLVYCVMHGLWLIAMAVLVFSALTGWFGKKAWRSGPREGNASRR